MLQASHGQEVYSEKLSGPSFSALSEVLIVINILPSRSLGLSQGRFFLAISHVSRHSPFSKTAEVKYSFSQGTFSKNTLLGRQVTL